MTTRKKTVLLSIAVVAAAIVYFGVIRDTKTYRLATFSPQGDVIRTEYSVGKPSLSGGTYRFKTVKGQYAEMPAASTQVTSDIQSPMRQGNWSGF